MTKLIHIITLTLLLLFVPGASTIAAVDFPGTAPGEVISSVDQGVFTLQNNVVSQSWQMTDGSLRPFRVINKITGNAFEQAHTELFRLSTKQPDTKPSQTYVGIRLDADRVFAVASNDGSSWTQIASFPRQEFPGDPRLVRLGKMNLHAESKDYTGEPGDVGAGRISEIKDHPPFEFKAGANQACTTEFVFPAGSTFVSCRIDRGTDKGQSWAPAMALVWEEGRRFLLVGLRDSHPAFNVTTADGERVIESKLSSYPTFDINGSTFSLQGRPKLSLIEPVANTARAADKIRGVRISADLVSQTGIHAHWKAELRDGSNYVRQTIELSSQNIVPLYGVELVDATIPQMQTIGSCPGSPAAGSGMFTGVEIPGSSNAIDASSVRIGFACKLELSASQSYQFGSVMGVSAPNQLRRSFLYYIERERARQSSPFLHYNDWYDLGFSVTAAKLEDAARQFDTELVKKRGVPVQSYLVDDGWDDTSRGLWAENLKTFPDGFAGVKTKLNALGSHLSIWISPLGGYGGAKERTDDARKMGLIPPDAELDFSYPSYKLWFQNRCLQLMREDGVNAFKWDRAGDGVSPHFMALLDVARNLRLANPNVFINVTVGTWPSPFWLNHVDSTWRMGSADVGWTGKGNERETWLTFRDGYCHRKFVEAAPLYPLNSVMHHGIVFGRCFQGAKVAKAGPDLKHEARSYFANGTNLQELYLTPSLMTADSWDQVAQAAKWAHANSDVLVDSHWVGGDPLKLDPYGYASWARRKGTLMLRNPDDQPKTISLDASVVFDLPADAPKDYALISPYKDQRIQSLELQAGEKKTVTLDPFEVLVFDANPT
jgi:hypothetical protein